MGRSKEKYEKIQKVFKKDLYYFLLHYFRNIFSLYAEFFVLQFEL
mgnify:CR=1 FL=1